MWKHSYWISCYVVLFINLRFVLNGSTVVRKSLTKKHTTPSHVFWRKIKNESFSHSNSKLCYCHHFRSLMQPLLSLTSSSTFFLAFFLSFFKPSLSPFEGRLLYNSIKATNFHYLFSLCYLWPSKLKDRHTESRFFLKCILMKILSRSHWSGLQHYHREAASAGKSAFSTLKLSVFPLYSFFSFLPFLSPSISYILNTFSRLALTLSSLV